MKRSILGEIAILLQGVDFQRHLLALTSLYLLPRACIIADAAASIRKCAWVSSSIHDMVLQLISFFHIGL
jgi:hypothetical protein